MKRLLLVALIVLTMGLGGCIFVTDDGGGVPAFDFNGIWSMSLTGCQAQQANAEIVQVGTSFTMFSRFRFDGVCDPFAATFEARTDGPWGFWTFAGGATGPDTLSGTYLYAEFLTGECTGTFHMSRIGFRGADAAPGEGLVRNP